MNIREKVKTVIKRITEEVSTTELVRWGMKVGTDFNCQQGSYIDPTHCFLIEKCNIFHSCNRLGS